MAARRALLQVQGCLDNPPWEFELLQWGRVSPNAPAHDEIEMAGAGAFRAKTRFWVLAQGGLDDLWSKIHGQIMLWKFTHLRVLPDNEIWSPQTQRELSESAKRIIV
jgi:hypothetical protein